MNGTLLATTLFRATFRQNKLVFDFCIETSIFAALEKRKSTGETNRIKL